MSNMESKNVSLPMAIAIFCVLLAAGFVGARYIEKREQLVEINAGIASDMTRQQRKGMQDLAQAIQANPKATAFRVYWSDGAGRNSEISYDKNTGTLYDGKKDGKTVMQYTGVTDAAIQGVAAKNDAVVGLSDNYGAKQVFLFNGEPFKPTAR